MTLIRAIEIGLSGLPLPTAGLIKALHFLGKHTDPSPQHNECSAFLLLPL